MSHFDLEGMLEFLQELLALEAGRDHLRNGPLFRAYGTPSPLSLGVVRGGDGPSSVPDWIQVEGRCGLFPGESTEEAGRPLPRRWTTQRGRIRGSGSIPRGWSGWGVAASVHVVEETVSVEDLEEAMMALAVAAVRFSGRRAHG